MTVINIETSCGLTFRVPVSSLDEEKLLHLLEHNAGRTDADPAEIAAIRKELQRRAVYVETLGRPRTHRDLYKDALGEVLYKSIGGSPWTDDVEDAIIDFHAKMEEAIDALPVLAEILDKPLPPEGEDSEDDDGDIPF